MAQTAADELAKEYDLTLRWDGDTLHLRRNGVEGRIEVSPSQIALEIRLGLLLKGLRRVIEKKAGERLDAVLAPRA